MATSPLMSATIQEHETLCVSVLVQVLSSLTESVVCEVDLMCWCVLLQLWFRSGDCQQVHGTNLYAAR